VSSFPGRELAEAGWLTTAEAAACPPAGQRVMGICATAI
jgi:8-oxo-dGTP diphosphatase